MVVSKPLLLRTQTELLRLKIEKIIYVSSDGNYSTFVMANGDKRTVTMQLGEIELLMSESSNEKDNIFIRIGKSLIVNYSYIYHISITRQQLTLSDNSTFSYVLSASRDALKKLKSVVEDNSLIN